MTKKPLKPVEEQGIQAGAQQSAESRSIGTSVDWEIPGDVPEAQRRSITPHRTTGKAPEQPHCAEGSAPSAPPSTTNTQQPPRRTVLPLQVVILLLIMLGLGGSGYLYFTGEAEQPVAVASEQIAVNDTAAFGDVPRVMQAVMNDVAETSPVLQATSVEPPVADNPPATAQAAQTPRIITHVVKHGDTLWDIAESYVNDPFRYPELAELSQIQNPDLIYPGDIVRIRV